MAGRTYRIDLEGAATGKGTLADPFLRWLRDSSGNGLHGTRDYDGGEGLNPRQVFTPQLSGTYYITASGQGASVGTYTLTVTDTSAPVFGASAYGFQLAENADGSTTRVSLGTVSATDPEGVSVGYSIVGGNESGSFEIDAASGELFYVGAGEDYEAGAAQFDLTIRASDGTLTADAAVSVAITDVPEQTIVVPVDPEILQSVSEPYGEDLPTNTSTIGRVAVGGTATGNIGRSGDRDGFAVELVAGRTYIIDLRGSETSDGTLNDPYLRGIKGPDGRLIAGLSDDDGGEGYNSQLNFTPTESGTHYIIAGAYSGLGTYEVEVRDVSPQTAQQETVNGPPAFGQASYGFTLAENTDGVSLGTVSASDPDDDPVAYSIEGGNESGSFEIDAASGELFYVGSGEDYETGSTRFDLTVRASDGTNSTDTTVIVNVGDVQEAPTFAQASYDFSLAENVDGSTSRVSLGTVSAVDPEGAALAYSLIGGDAGGLFEIDAQSGELFYTGAGEDFESGATRFNLTIRASDGALSADAAVSVNVTDAPEPTDDRAAATDLGDITDLALPQFSRGTLDAAADAVAWYRFELTEAKNVGLGLRQLSADADLILEDAEGNVVHRGSRDGTANEWLSVTLLAGTYYVRLEAQEAGSGGYMFRYGLADANEAPVKILDYSDPRWTDHDFNYGAGWSGRGFGLTGSQRGAPEEIEIAEVDGVTALRFKSAERDQSWYDEHPEAVGHGVHGHADSGLQDDFIMPNLVWTTGDNPYLIAQIHLGGSENRTSLRMPAIYETKSGDEVRTFPGILYNTDQILLRGPGRADIRVNPSGHPNEGWVTLGMTVTNSGDIVYVGKSGTHSLAELFADPDFRYYNSEVSHSFKPYVPVTGGSSGMFSQEMPDGLPNSIAYVEFGTDLALGDTTAGGPDDHPVGTDTGATVAVDGSVRGEIEHPGDQDWFAVILEAGTTYRIDLEGSDTGDGTLSDPYLRGVYDADGVRISGTNNDDGGAGYNSRLPFTATEDATYYVAAGAYGNDTGTYTLSVTDVTDTSTDDFTAGTETGGAVDVGGSVRGEVDFLRDQDWFAVTLEAGKTYRIDLEGSDTGAGTLSDPYLRGVYDADGVRIPGTTGYDGRLFFTATEDATYYVAAGAYGNDTGTYTLSVTDVTDASTNDLAAGTGTGGAVDVGGSVRGEVDFLRDQDWFAVTLEAGKTYRIDLEGSDTGAGTLDDPYLRSVYDADGVRISGTANDEGGEGHNSRLFFTATEDATYYVAAGAYGDRVGTYTLSVEEVVDGI